MNQEKNYKTIKLVLTLGCVSMGCLSIFVKDRAEKNILIGITGGFFFALLLQFILVKMKPGSFKDKWPNPDEESQ